MMNTSPVLRRNRSRSRSRNNRRRNRQYVNPASVPLIEEIIDTEAVIAALPTKESTVFRVQLAHGSDMKQIEVFDNLPELYRFIRSAFSDVAEDVLFCTINTHKVDMDHLLSCNVGFNDVIYAHLAGAVTEMKFMKSECNLGLTITDNGAGKAFIKRVRSGSIGDRVGLTAGQHIAKINGEDMTGLRHFDVAKVLRNLNQGQEVTMMVVSPLQSGFSFIAPRPSAKAPTKAIEEGGMTLRLKAQGPSVVEAAPIDTALLAGVNAVFESYLGVNDDQLAQQVAEMATEAKTLVQLTQMIKDSDLSIFQLPDEFIFDVWGVMSDVKGKTKE